MRLAAICRVIVLLAGLVSGPFTAIGQGDAFVVRTLSDSVSWYRSRNPRRALDFGFEVIRQAQEEPATRQLADVYTEMGNVYVDQGLYQLAIEAYSQALAIRRQLRMWERVGWSYNDLGYVYDRQHQFDLALARYRQGEAQFRAMGQAGQAGLGHTLTNIASLYDDRDAHEQAAAYYTQALQLFEQGRQTSLAADARLSLGRSAMQAGRYGSAQQYLEAALQYYQQASAPNHVGRAQLLLGQLADSLRQLPQAREHYQAALELFQQTGNHEYVAKAVLRLARIARRTGEYPRAQSLTNQALGIALQHELQPTRLEALRELVAQAEARGDLARALACFRQVAAQQDSLAGGQAVQASLEKELEHQWAAARTEAARYDADRRLRRVQLWFLGGVAAVLLTIVAVLVLFLRQTRQLAAQEKRMLAQEEELSRLKAEQLGQELHQRQRELSTLALDLVHSNEQLAEVLGEFNQLKPYLNTEGRHQMHQLVVRRQVQGQDEHWRTFDREFQRLHENFYERLEGRCPDLTAGERQLCALLRMKLSNAEITAITLRSLNSVYTTKSRLRKKLGVETDEGLLGFLETL